MKCGFVENLIVYYPDLTFNAAGKYYYGVSIMNGKQLGAGTNDPEVCICLIGSNGHSDKIYLQSLLSMRALTGQTLHRGTWDNLIIESSGDLGEIQVVILGINKVDFLSASWYVNEVGIYNFQSKNQEAFPCYFWIGNGESVSFTSKTSKKSIFLLPE